MATGAKLMKEISDQFLVCQICLQPFKEPKTLSCLHTFCCACVQQQYDAESNRPTRYTLYTRSVTCPLCRKKTELPTGGVRRLQDNFLVSNLTDVLAKRCVSKVPPCEICHTVRQRSNDACSKCLDCDKLLCRACVDLHSTTKVTQSHCLIDVEGQKDIECKVHPEETVRFYCELCEECICVVCTFQEHKDHDVCSFGDGFVKYRSGLETLLGKSKQRLAGLTSRLQAIDKYERQSKELKEKIRDQAISYTSQVRAREKELIKKVDEVMGGEVVTRLTESKSWLQETFDNLQSACNLTEIVMKDKGVEMLLLKKEIQGKMDLLLAGPMPPDLPDLRQLDVQFVPGEVKLGDVCVPDLPEGGEQKRTGSKGGDQLVENDRSSTPLFSKPNCAGSDSCRPCTDCAERKQEEENERKRTDRYKDERKVSTKSVYIQTKPQESLEADNDSDGDGGRGRRRNGPHANSVNTVSSSTATPVTSRDAGAGSEQRRQPAEGSVPRGTMTERQAVRTLKTQTEESCLRNNRLGQAAAMGTSYPNTGGAIAAAFLRHSRASDDDLVMTRSGPDPNPEVMTRSGPNADPNPPLSTCSPVRLAEPDVRNAEAATEISVGVSGNWCDVLDAFRQAGWEDDGGGMTEDGRPDLLAQTAVNPSSGSSPWIRSRRVQTNISALRGNTSVSTGDKFVTDEELNKFLFGPVARPPEVTRRDSASSPLFHRPRASRQTQPSAPTAATRDAASMTSFKMKMAPDATAEKETSVEPATLRDAGVMTSQEKRTVYIQTKGARVTSTATSTDHEGRMSKSTCTVLVTTSDAETIMPRVTHETRGTWTEAVATSERTTCTDCLPTSDAATLTTKTKTGEFGAQMKPIGVVAATNTTMPRLCHRPSQTNPPPVTDKGTMFEPALFPSPSSSSLSLDQTTPLSLPLDQTTPLSLPLLLPPLPVSPSTAATSGLAGNGAVAKADKAVETTRTKNTTRAVGPNTQMYSSRTIATDTLHLLQVTDKETATPTVKTVDDWTLTPQPQVISTGVTPPRPAYLEVGVATTPIVSMDQATYTEVKTTRESGTESYLVVCDSETLTDRMVQCDAQTEATFRPSTQSVGTSTEKETTEGEETEKEKEGKNEERTDGDGLCPPPSPLLSLIRRDSACQCSKPELLSKEVNTTRLRRKAKEVQTSYSYVECRLCHCPESRGPAKIFTESSTDPNPGKLFTDNSTDPSPGKTFTDNSTDPSPGKTFTDNSTDPSPGKTFTDNSTEPSPGKTFTDNSTDPGPRDTHDVGTMALSCLPSPPAGLADFGVQTSEVSLYDRCVATSFEFDDDSLPPSVPRPFLGLECQDAATSTESLPYIGLLSEIDVDELIVFPEAHFELVGDDYYDCESDPVPMVDDETWMESLDFAEVGTQTLLPTVTALGEGPVELVNPEDDCTKCLVSIGVNTTPKATFEKETSTPIRHLFSKGTMTFYVAKMDKATSTISNTRAPAEGRPGVVREARRRAVEHKVTMTSRTDQKDMAVETDPTLVEGRITECISKLRNVSQRLNSPTARKNRDGEVFFPHTFSNSQAGGSKSEVRTGSALPVVSSPKSPASPHGKPHENKELNAVFATHPPPSGSQSVSEDEQQRQKQVHKLLVETDVVLKAKDVSPVRKAQPITTLKPRTPVTPGDGYGSNSLPRQHSLERHKKVKMGSQVTPPAAANRLPLLRYNSAPDRIAAVPAKTLLRTAGQPSSSPRTSPSRIPVSQTKGQTTLPATDTPAAAAATTAGGVVSSDTGPESDVVSPTASASAQKVQARPCLPSISETRTPSSCSDSFFVSPESADVTSLVPAAPSHSRTPSDVISVSDTAGSDVTQSGQSVETASNDGDDSSVSSLSTALAVPAVAPVSRSPSPGTTPKKDKKEKKGFMQRLLSGAKKKQKDAGEKDCASTKLTVDSTGDSNRKQQPQAPSSPQGRPKQPKPPTGQGGAKPKQSPIFQRTPTGSTTLTTSPSQIAAPSLPPPSHLPVSIISDPTSPHSSHSPRSSGESDSSAAAAVPLPPHHYPPLPDPSKTPPPARKPQPFVIVQHRIMSIQQDNVEELTEKKEKEKEGKKGKEKEKEGKKEEKEKEKEGKKGKEKEETRERKEEEKGKIWGKDRTKVKVTVDAKAKDKVTVDAKAKDKVTVDAKAKDKVTVDAKAKDKVTVDAKAKDKGKVKTALLCKHKTDTGGGRETNQSLVLNSTGRDKGVKKIEKANETRESACLDKGVKKIEKANETRESACLDKGVKKIEKANETRESACLDKGVKKIEKANETRESACLDKGNRDKSAKKVETVRDSTLDKDKRDGRKSRGKPCKQ